MAKKKNTGLWIGLGLLAGAGLLWWHQSQKNLAAAASPQLALPPSTTAVTASAGPQPLTAAPVAYTSDIAAVMARLAAPTQTAFQMMLAKLTPSEMTMMDSIAHSWNNGIALTSDQVAFWSAYGVF